MTTKTTRIGLVGYGQIGRAVHRVAHEHLHTVTVRVRTDPEPVLAGHGKERRDMENLGGLENRVGAVCDPGIGMHVTKSVPDLVDIDAVRTGTVT